MVPLWGIIDVGLLALKLLAIAGGAALGALVVGLVVKLAAKNLSGREVPRPVMTLVRALGAVAAGLAVWLWAFGPPGPGGWGGGGGGWWPFGQSGQNRESASASTGSSRSPTTQPQAQMPRDTLTITMRGGEEVDRDKKFWVIQGDPPRGWEEVTRAILEHRRENRELKFLKIVTLDASVADDHPAVIKLKKWAREQGLETVGP